MTNLCLFAVMFMLKTGVLAEAITDGQTWAHRDTVSSSSYGGSKDGRNVISPRMDFDQWTPLGRGDPLKNDPTFDYLPPVLDKVHYWKPPPPPSPVNGRPSHSPSTVAPPPPQTVNYNRRFFLTDYSKKEPAAYVQYVVHKRPLQMSAAATAAAAAGYHYPMPKTPLPMLTPPPYQRPSAATTVEPAEMLPAPSWSQYAAGDSAAESKQPPAVRAPPPVSVPVSGVRPVPSHSVIKVLLDNEVDRTTVTTTTAASTTTTTSTTSSSSSTTAEAPAYTAERDDAFSRYKQSAAVAADRPMYLIIQGHSKVKTYGLLSKSEDLSAAPATATAHENNHIGGRQDDGEPSRRKRGGPPRPTRR